MEGALTLRAGQRSQPSTLRLYWNRLRRSPGTMLGFLVVVISLFFAVAGPLIAPYGYADQIPTDRLEPSSLKHWLGTDQYGRDIFSRLMYGIRDIYLIAGTAALLSVILGTALGLTAGYLGGWFDEISMRLLDVLLAIPPILLGMVLLGTVGPSRVNIILVVGLLRAPSVARVVRSQALDLKTREFVEAARLQGESNASILLREILPNVVPALMVEASMRFCYAIFMVASLGFLGLGIQPPTPDWGMMVNEARDWYSEAPWMLLFPAGAIAVLILGVSLFADGLRQVLRPGITGD